MIARKKYHPTPAHPDWQRLTEVAAPGGRYLRPGVEFRIRGERGRFRFLRYVVTPTTSWIDCVGPNGQYRAFRLDRVRTVHVARRMRPAA